MEIAPRQTGKLAVDERLRAVLGRLREIEGVTEPGRLEVEAVRDVDRGLGWRLPDDLLAVFAARLRFLEEQRDLSLAKVIGHTGKVRALGAPGDVIGVGKLPDRRWLCLKKGAQPGEGTLLFVLDLEEEGTERVSLVEWLEALLREREELERPAASVPAPDETEFAPALVRSPPAGSPGNRVRHKVFGEGVVLKEVGSGPARKAKVDFPGKGLKLIQARFLEWLE